jgi:hypothetical protein
MFDTQTGEVELRGGVKVGPDFAVEKFLASPLREGAGVMYKKPPRESYSLAHFESEGNTWSVSLFFYKGRISCMFIYNSYESLLPDEWSEPVGRKRMELYNQWLKEKLGEPPYIYPWGQIRSAWDSKNVDSVIQVNYLYYFEISKLPFPCPAMIP